jgi:hypothetical protein
MAKEWVMVITWVVMAREWVMVITWAVMVREVAGNNLLISRGWISSPPPFFAQLMRTYSKSGAAIQF